jgi:hypothetical protein
LLNGSAGGGVSPLVVLVDVVVVSVVVVVLVVVLEPFADSIVFAGFETFAGLVAFAVVFVVVFGALAVVGFGGFAGFCDTVVLTFGEDVVFTFGAGAVLTVGFGLGPLAAIASIGAVPMQSATAAATAVHTNFSNLIEGSLQQGGKLAKGVPQLDQAVSAS